MLKRRMTLMGLAVGMAATPAAAQELRIGFLAPTTGIFAQVGKDMVSGFQLWLDESGGNFGGDFSLCVRHFVRGDWRHAVGKNGVTRFAACT